MFQKRVLGRMMAVLFVMMLLTLLSGCSSTAAEEKLRNLEFVVLSEERIPEELKTILEEKKAQPFQITYQDMENLYICVGYGEQDTAGYSVTVDDLYLTKNTLVARTTLLGPDNTRKPAKALTYPMIVLRTELRTEPVVFQ